jgi:hypothetical protein
LLTTASEGANVLVSVISESVDIAALLSAHIS